MRENTSVEVLTNFIWRFAERFGAQAVGTAVSIILARILDPADYGTVALMMVFINILSVFIDCGFGTALIQRKDADDLDFSTIFYFNIVSCTILYLIIFIMAPFIADFYDNPAMTSMMRVLGLTFLISGVKSVQTAFVAKHMMFKRFFFSTLGGTIGSGIIGIGLAFAGYGAWAIIAQSLINNLVDTVILWCTVQWRPKRMFSIKRLRQLFSFGWKLLASMLLDTVYNNLQSLVIGRIYTTEDLAFYNRGEQWPALFIDNINTSIDSVLLPAMSAAQDNSERIKAMTRRAIKTSTYLMAPCMVGLAACSKPLIRLVLTEKWLPCAPFMVIFCLTYMFYPIHTANLNAINALGRSDLFLKLEIIKKIVGLIALIITAPISVMAMTYSLLFTCAACQIINSWPNKKLLHYGYMDQLKDILPGILLAVLMGLIVYLVQWLHLTDFMTLLIQIPAGVLVYVAGSKLLKLDTWEYVVRIVLPYVSSFKSKTHKTEE